MSGLEERGRGQRIGSDRRLDQAIGAQGITQAIAIAPDSPGPERKAAHEAADHRRDGEDRHAHHQAEQARPDHLVDQPGRPGEEEEGEDQDPTGIAPPRRGFLALIA